MEFLNHKITEAVCAFRFNPDANNWDITSVADFFKRIEPFGFTKKQEIKPFQLNFQIKGNELPEKPNMVQGDIQMVFKNEAEDYAILVGNNYLSFHTINHYPGWDRFMDSLIKKSMDAYLDLGYGKGLVSAQMIYINNFELDQSKKLSDYLSFVPDSNSFGNGEELSNLFQSAYHLPPNKRLQIKTIFNKVQPENKKKVTLECNCVSNNNEKQEISWEELAQDAHDSAKNAFIEISTDYFKKEIK